MTMYLIVLAVLVTCVSVGSSYPVGCTPCQCNVESSHILRAICVGKLIRRIPVLKTVRDRVTLLALQRNRIRDLNGTWLATNYPNLRVVNIMGQATGCVRLTAPLPPLIESLGKLMFFSLFNFNYMYEI